MQHHEKGEEQRMSLVSKPYALRLRSLDPDEPSLERVPQVFRNWSTVELAQAGVYKGINDIQEYIGFAYSSESPYFSQGPHRQAFSFRFLGYRHGVCHFRMAYKSTYVTDPQFSRCETKFSLSNMLRVSLNFKGRYVEDMSVYYTAGFLEYFFGYLLDSAQTRSYICDSILNGTCLETLGGSIDNCALRLAALPLATGEKAYVDGNSQGCRALHAAFAATNPENHCVHVALDERVDPSGRIKCQVSSNRNLEDAFSKRDLRFFRRFQKRNGINPDMGHDGKECSPETP